MDFLKKLLIILGVLGTGLVVGALFGLVATAVSGNPLPRALGPWVGMVSALLAWRAALAPAKR